MATESRRMFAGVSRYHKFDIAHGQLETAIRLFLTEGCDVFSVVTLAGAADTILSQLVLNAGKEPFVDYAIKVFDWRKLGPTPPRNKYYKAINKFLFVNALKHLDPNDDEFVEFDAEKAAIDSLIKAIADYKTFTGNETGSMKAFFAWTYKNLDSEKIMEGYKNVPKNLK